MRTEEEITKKVDKGLKRRKIILISLVVLAVLSVSAAVVNLYITSKLDKIKPDSGEEKIEYTDIELSCVDVDGFINILFLGIDSRDMNKIEGWRADAIIIASIKEETGEVFLTSVYRDTFLLLGEEGFYDKVTHSFYYGGMKESMITLNKSMDLNIKNYVVFNFKAVSDVIDAMGGIDIDIEEYEINELNRVIKETCKFVGNSDVNLIYEPGTHHVDGAQAVAYGRIRKGVGDDFKRTERMRIVISKVLEKVKTMSLSDIDKIIELGISQIKTNLSNQDILGIGMRAPKFKIAGSVGFPYTVVTGTLNGTSFVFPYNLYGDVAKLHEELFAQEGYEPSETVAMISNEILAYYAMTENQNEVDVNQYYENPTEQPELIPSDEGEGEAAGWPSTIEENTSGEASGEETEGDNPSGENSQNTGEESSEGQETSSEGESAEGQETNPEGEVPSEGSGSENINPDSGNSGEGEATEPAGEEPGSEEPPAEEVPTEPEPVPEPEPEPPAEENPADGGA